VPACGGALERGGAEDGAEGGVDTGDVQHRVEAQLEGRLRLTPADGVELDGGERARGREGESVSQYACM
jgi:hypothetical protein